MAHVSMSRNSGKISPRSPLSPRLKQSPFSKRTVDQCPIIRKSQNGDDSSEDSAIMLTSHDKAQLRRSMGDKMNQRMYPKSWEMASERPKSQNAGTVNHHVMKLCFCFCFVCLYFKSIIGLHTLLMTFRPVI